MISCHVHAKTKQASLMTDHLYVKGIWIKSWLMSGILTWFFMLTLSFQGSTID